MHTKKCVLIEISMEIGMLYFWLGLLVTALVQLTGWFQDLLKNLKRVLKPLQSYNFLAGKVTKVNLVVIEDDIDGYKLPILYRD